MINLKTQTKNKASLKLYNQITSYLFEQEFGELKGNGSVKAALKQAILELSKMIK